MVRVRVRVRVVRVRVRFGVRQSVLTLIEVYIHTTLSGLWLEIGFRV